MQAQISVECDMLDNIMHKYSLCSLSQSMSDTLLIYIISALEKNGAKFPPSSPVTTQLDSLIVVRFDSIKS